MSIKEALERLKINGERTDEPGQDRGQAYWDKHRLIGSSYKERVLETGRAIHREAGVPGFLGELAEIIRPDFGDVRVNDLQRMANGAVSLKIEWSFQDRPDKNKSFLKYEYNAVEVEAYPLTEDVVVWGKEGGQLLTKDQWGSDRKLIEEAIARAYQNPMKMAGPPTRL